MPWSFFYTYFCRFLIKYFFPLCTRDEHESKHNHHVGASTSLTERRHSTPLPFNNFSCNCAIFRAETTIHGWPSTQPGSLHTALQRKYTQPCPLFSRGTAVWTMGARLCEQWDTAVCKCPAVLRVTRVFSTSHTLYTWFIVSCHDLVTVICFRVTSLCFLRLYYSAYWIHMMCFPVFFRVASLALGQSYDCPRASEATLKNMGNHAACIY